MDDESELSFLVSLDRLEEFGECVYGMPEQNPIINWLVDNVGPITHPVMWPLTGENWKCWVAYDPSRNYAVSYCEVNFTINVDDSIISFFILRWT